ncbi:MAG: (2Fe-2S)-binding protein [Spirochaetaceae bacterium]|nr:(2Fe-2S)-binding protein [Spirochaetaceae bacterium]
MDTKFITVNLTINNRSLTVQADRKWTLLYYLREVLELTGTKYGCGTNDCGACKVLIDGEAKNSCVVLLKNLDGKSIVTIEGLQKNGELNTIQQSFVDAGAVQCGFCTPGMIVSTTALLAENPEPSEEEIRKGLDGNLCRCTGYVKIVDAVQLASSRLKEADNG